jgi:hypothetical protein
MVFKPNYNQQRAERNRQKQAKKEAKLRDRDEAATRRKLDQDEAPPESDQPAEAATGGSPARDV